MSAAFGVILFTILCHGVSFYQGGGGGGGGRVTVGVVFINSLLSPSTVFSDWSDISQGGSEKNFHSLLLIMNLINIH